MPDGGGDRKKPSPDDLRWLAAHSPGLRVSIYLPLATGPESRQNPVRLKGACDSVIGRLEQLGAEAELQAEWRRRLGGVDVSLREQPAGTEGLAIFLDLRGLRAFPLARRTGTRTSVSASFTLRPLLAALQHDRPYRVLAFSPSRIAIYAGDARGLEEMPLGDGLPSSLADALGPEVGGGSLQYHSGGPRGSEPIYHGQGGAADERALDVDRFHKAVRPALERHLRREDTPLVYAADEVHLAFLRRLRIPSALEEALALSPDSLAPAELHQGAWPIVLRAREEECERLVEAFERARNRGKGVAGLPEVTAAAVAGRVRQLFVSADREAAGHIDEETSDRVAGTGDDDVLEELVSLVLRRGGEAWVLEESPLLREVPAAATLR
jgi:hypothetical protein